jgi:hypothetical protein
MEASKDEQFDFEMKVVDVGLSIAEGTCCAHCCRNV